MFDSKQMLTHRLTDTADLLIDFATLGEYGLEPISSTPTACEGARKRPMPIASRESFSDVLFPNRTRGSVPERFASRPTGAPCAAHRPPQPAPHSGADR